MAGASLTLTLHVRPAEHATPPAPEVLPASAALQGGRRQTRGSRHPGRSMQLAPPRSMRAPAHLARLLRGDVADQRLGAAHGADGHQVHADDQAAHRQRLGRHLQPAACRAANHSPVSPRAGSRCRRAARTQATLTSLHSAGRQAQAAALTSPALQPAGRPPLRKAGPWQHPLPSQSQALGMRRGPRESSRCSLAA